MSGPYRPPMPSAWYLRTQPYRVFMLRELTSVFIAGYLVFLIVLLVRLGQGYEQYAAMMESLRSPLAVIAHGLALAAAVFHSITWFNLTPQVMPIRIGEEQVPGAVVAIGAGYLPWLTVSGVILWGVMR